MSSEPRSAAVGVGRNPTPCLLLLLPHAYCVPGPVYGVRMCSNFIFFLPVAVQFSQHHLLKSLSLSHCKFLPPLSKIRYP